MYKDAYAEGGEYMNVKHMIEAAGFAVGAAAGYLFGPLDAALQGMLVLMAVDVAVGMIDAFVGVSNKTPGGKISSDAMVKGLAKKCGELAMVIVGNALDYVSGMNIVRTGVVFTIIIAETISIVENVSLLGVVDIPIINKALEVLKEKGDNDASKGD